METLLEQAFKKISKLDADEQNQIAEEILALAKKYEMNEEDEDLEDIPPEHLEAVLDGLAQAERREFAPEEEVNAMLARFRR